MSTRQSFDLLGQGRFLGWVCSALSQGRPRPAHHAADPSLRRTVVLAQVIGRGPLLVGSHHFFSWRSPGGAPIGRSSGVADRCWQRSFRQYTITTPLVEFAVASRGFQRGQGQHPLGRPTHPLVFATGRHHPVRWISPPGCSPHPQTRPLPLFVVGNVRVAVSQGTRSTLGPTRGSSPTPSPPSGVRSRPPPRLSTTAPATPSRTRGDDPWDRPPNSSIYNTKFPKMPPA